MGRRPTLKDVARAAGVHVSTVSRALDPETDHPVTQALADHVRKVSEELGYLPNAEAYSLRTRRTRMLGVVIPDITDPVYALILKGLEDALLPRRYVSIVASLDGDISREADVTALLRSRNVDGLILGSVAREDSVVSKLVDQGVPLVTLGRRVDGVEASSVTSDHSAGIRAAIAHLRDLGHARIAHLAGPQTLSTGADRLAAFRDGCAALGIEADPARIVAANAYSIDEGRRCAGELAERATGATAIVCANDRLALGAICALREQGISCPGDVSVTGYNDMPLVDLMSPALTTIRVPLREIGARAANLLLDLLAKPEGERPQSHIVLPVELVVRASTAAAAA